MMKHLSLIVLLLASLPALAQYRKDNRRADDNVKESGKDSARHVTLIGVNYAFTIPGADMAKRYGPNSNIGGNVWYKTSTNWLFGAEYNYMFGSDIKETGILDKVSTSSGYLINAQGQYQVLSRYERGHQVMFQAGKVFPLFGPNDNSGLMVKLGAGFMEHKIKYYWNGQDPPQLQGDYIKGYDRLTNGFASSQSVGYLNLSNSHKVNFSAEFVITEGFTQSRRDWDFDLMRKDTKQRLDLLYGIKLCWYFPIYGKRGDNTYYY